MFPSTQRTGAASALSVPVVPLLDKVGGGCLNTGAQGLSQRAARTCMHVSRARRKTQPYADTHGIWTSQRRCGGRVATISRSRKPRLRSPARHDLDAGPPWPYRPLSIVGIGRSPIRSDPLAGPGGSEGALQIIDDNIVQSPRARPLAGLGLSRPNRGHLLSLAASAPPVHVSPTPSACSAPGHQPSAAT